MEPAAKSDRARAGHRLVARAGIGRRAALRHRRRPAAARAFRSAGATLADTRPQVGAKLLKGCSWRADKTLTNTVIIDNSRLAAKRNPTPAHPPALAAMQRAQVGEAARS